MPKKQPAKNKKVNIVIRPAHPRPRRLPPRRPHHPRPRVVVESYCNIL